MGGSGGGKWRKGGNHQEIRVGNVGSTSTVADKWEKMGEEWEQNGTKYPVFTVPFPPFLRRPKNLPTVPFVKFGTQVSGGEMGGRQGIRQTGYVLSLRLAPVAVPGLSECSDTTSKAQRICWCVQNAGNSATSHNGA